MTWDCFWTEETGEVEISLRRWTMAEGVCPEAGGYHNARSEVIGRYQTRMSEGPDGERARGRYDPAEFAGDARWPTKCACGYVFADDDERQVTQEAVHVRPDTGETWAFRSLPIGAMFNSWWYPENWRNPADGLAVTVILPNLCGGVAQPGMGWNVDGPSNDGDGHLHPHAWTRTGDPKAVPPTVDVNPSIDAKGDCYHGYLRCVDGRTILIDPL